MNYKQITAVEVYPERKWLPFSKAVQTVNNKSLFQDYSQTDQESVLARLFET